MNNRWFAANGNPKKVNKEWRAEGRQEYAMTNRNKFVSHQIQWFQWDFEKIYAHEPLEDRLSRLVAFIGLYDNQKKCAPRLFSVPRYIRGAILMIGYNDLPPHIQQVWEFEQRAKGFDPYGNKL